MSAALRVRRRATVLVTAVACVIPALAVLAAPAGPAMEPRGGAQPPAAHLPPPPGSTSRASVGAKGVQANGGSVEGRISGDGRWVVFTSIASNLVAADTNNAQEVFVRDLQNGATERIPLPRNAPVPTGGRADQPSISANGEFVVFRYRPPSSATVSTQTRVYLWQRGKGTSEIAADLASNNRREPAIAPDGSWVAFTGTPPPSAAGTTTPAQVYAWNRTANQTVLVSANVRAGPGNAASSLPSISNGGAFVTFQSSATTLAPDPNPQGQDVFIRDMASGAMTLISARPGAGPSPGASPLPAEYSEQAVLSGDGRFVAFATSLRLSGQDTNSFEDVYRWNRESRAFELVSLNAASSGSTGGGQPAINGDGRYVGFTTLATALVTAPVPGATTIPSVFLSENTTPTEIYLRDMTAPETVRISVTLDGASAGTALRPSVATDGSRVTFETGNANLVQGDTNQAFDVFVRNLPPVASAVPNPMDFGSLALGLETLPAAVIVGSDGWADLRVTGVTLAGANPGDFRIVAEACTAKALPRGVKCPVTVTYKPTAAGDRSAELRIAHQGPGSPRTVRLIGRATDARLTVEPGVGQLGRVVIATGSGFPAGAAVKLAWFPGITPKLPPIVADPQGNFVVQVLVFHRDMLGPRILRAEPAGPVCFPAVEARYLVVAGSGRPPSYPGAAGAAQPIFRGVGNAGGSVAIPSQAPCVPGSGPVAPVITPGPTLPPVLIPATPPPTGSPKPTPTPTPAPTPTPTPVPDTTPPSLSGMSVNPPSVSYGSCGSSTTLSVNASDASGVVTVRVWFNPPAPAFGWQSRLLSLFSGSATNGTWRTTITTASGWSYGDMPYYVIGTDSRGNSRQLPASSPFPVIPVSPCIL